jgi:desulfoferrodoxin-like iron-binding protein
MLNANVDTNSSEACCAFGRRGGEQVTEKGEIYVCEICGNKVQVLETGAGTLVCCGQDMVLTK